MAPHLFSKFRDQTAYRTTREEVRGTIRHWVARSPALNSWVFPDRLMVGHQVLVLAILVRVQVREPRILVRESQQSRFESCHPSQEDIIKKDSHSEPFLS